MNTINMKLKLCNNMLKISQMYVTLCVVINISDGPEENSSKLLSTPFIEDPQHRLKWIAYLEFTHNEEVEDLTWDKVTHSHSSLLIFFHIFN